MGRPTLFFLVVVGSSIGSPAGGVWGQFVATTDFQAMGRSVHRSQLTVYDDAIYFGVGVDDTSRRELWSYDGAQAKLISDRFQGGTETDIDDFVVFDGDLYFSADDGTHGNELWRYDGREVTLVADINPGPTGSDPTTLTVYDGALYFGARQVDTFNKLWKYDGSRVTNVATFARPDASVSLGTVHQGELYFSADDGSTGRELWKFDGRQAIQLADINAGPGGSSPNSMLSFGNELLFLAHTPELGEELWKFDGSGVTLIEDLNPGFLPSEPLNLTVKESAVYFSAQRGKSRDLFRYAGSEVEPVVARAGGPIVLGDDLFVLRGRNADRVEYVDMYLVQDSVATLYRETVDAAGPYVTLNGELYFSCECSNRELFKLALAGDSDVDGDVDFGDFLRLAGNFGRPGEWKQGDFDGDGSVEFADFASQATNFGKFSSGALAGSAFTAAVPEPTACLLVRSAGLLFGVAIALKRTRRVDSCLLAAQCRVTARNWSRKH
jgi:ELWxxDGT repeat protein